MSTSLRNLWEPSAYSIARGNVKWRSDFNDDEFFGWSLWSSLQSRSASKSKVSVSQQNAAGEQTAASRWPPVISSPLTGGDSVEDEPAFRG